jgi:calcium-dependent protein kinase
MSTVVGTPYYIAPEIIRGQPYGLQCDVWSLGVILFMLLTGIPPVTGDTDPELLNNVAKGNLSLVNQWTPDWNEMADAFDLITKMLTTDPNQRITSKGIMNHPWMGKRNLHTAPVRFACVVVVANRWWSTWC